MISINDASKTVVSIVRLTSRAAVHSGATFMQIQSEPSQFALKPLPMATNGHKLILAAAGFQAHAFKAMVRFQIETLSFLKHRCEQDVKLVDDLVAGNEFNDAFDVLSNFFQNATSDYAIEAGKVASIGSNLASETARRIRREAETTIEDMAASTAA
ncbi:phasin family protein [Mesorhizobium sp. M00.F.Ca.ET.216.01.1.1]|uniref:phasin family protein n=1 Tax=Mesorhizobium sp. M00.F.Ca.ET.216.01.1.1 TaxID=2500528 RepID=UPI001FDEF309|nr:phasin family protein [Mesorhizobium sp. M00.F.Ca.ET.216.01.1.1]